MNLFENTNVDFETLKQRAFNQRWAEQDEGVIPLTAADIDFPVAKEITQAVIDYSSKGYFSYGPALGYQKFREAISGWYWKNHMALIDEKLVLGFNSAAEALDKISALLFDKGGNALIPDPVDFLFKTSIERQGGKVRTFKFDPVTGAIDMDYLRDQIDFDTKAIFLCNPNNPTGLPIQDDDVFSIIELCVENDIWLVSDEIWLDIYYEQKVKSICSFGSEILARTFVISGLSKNFGLAGLRIGYCICPDLARYNALLKVSGHNETIGGLSTLSQVAATTALTDCDYWINAFRMHLKSMRDLVIREVNEMEGFSVQAPIGTYLAFIKIESGIDEEIMAMRIKEKAKVALVPGAPRWFGERAKGHLRLCFSTSMAQLEEALVRLKKFSEEELATNTITKLNI